MGNMIDCPSCGGYGGVPVEEAERLDNLITQVEELQRQLDRALSRRNEAHHDASEAEQECDRLLTQIEELRRQLKAARQVEADLGRELSEARGAQAPELESLRESYSNVVSQHGRALAERDEAYSERDKALAEFDRVVGELQRWKDAHARMADDVKKAFNERDEALAELAKARQGGKDYAQSYFDAILAERDKAYRDRDEARELVANCKTRMQDLEQRAWQAERVTNGLSSRVRASRQRILAELNAIFADDGQA